MASLVTELQRDVLDNSISVSNLLRKALVIARKLQLREVEEWIPLELNGYNQGESLPDYRRVRGEVKAFNSYNGNWIPAIFEDAKFSENISTGLLLQPMGELEEIFKEAKQETLVMSFSYSVKKSLIELMEFPMDPKLLISKAQIRGVLDAVRTIILEWSLKLEQEGIIGEGMTFSKEEKQAATTTIFNIQIMHHSQIQQGTHDSTQTMSNQGFNIEEVKKFIESLKPIVDQLGLDVEKKAELVAEIETIEPQLSSPKPKVSIETRLWPIRPLRGGH